jgi:hypothetical protein
MAVLFTAVVLFSRAFAPWAVLLTPVVFAANALKPTATLFVPALTSKALQPSPVFVALVTPSTAPQVVAVAALIEIIGAAPPEETMGAVPVTPVTVPLPPAETQALLARLRIFRAVPVNQRVPA